MAEKTFKVWAFENNKEKGLKGLYLCDGPDMVSDLNDNGDVDDLADALIVEFMPYVDPVEGLKQFDDEMKKLKFSIDWEKQVMPHYTAKEVELTPEQYAEQRERNEW